MARIRTVKPEFWIDEKPEPRYLEIARHSTAWPACYRNYFAASPGTKDFDTLEDMVLAGWAETTHRMDGLTFFRMTEKAFEALRAEQPERIV